MTDFKSLGVCNWILRQLKEIGLNKPSTVQEVCIPEILNGRDCIGVAKTGSGKTLAFALPILQTLSEDPYGIYAVVLTPTRELAYQINDQFNIIGIGMGLRSCVVVGGINMVTQQKELDRRPHIIIGTPGRVADHLDSNSTFSLARVKYLVLDEADRLLKESAGDEIGGFSNQLSTIFSALPAKRQTLLFTATNSETVSETIKACPNNPFVYEYDSSNDKKTVETLDQYFILVPVAAKNCYLMQLVLDTRERSPNGSIMIFVKSCKLAETLDRTFKKLGVPSACLHSMRPMSDRISALSKFKGNQIKVLIATDVASRGLDIPEVQLVINHNVPKDPRDYVHRVGRTARAGRGGKAITFVIPTQIGLLQAVEEEVGVKMNEWNLDEVKISEILLQVNSTFYEVNIDMESENWDERKATIKRKNQVMQGLDPDAEDAKERKRKAKEIKKFKREKLRMVEEAQKNHELTTEPSELTEESKSTEKLIRSSKKSKTTKKLKAVKISS
jgi:ATP-dependent RNA helicase DDX49/DBP8